MKKIFTLTAALLVTTLGFVSCNKSEQDVKVPEEGFRYSFILDDSETRATLDNSGVLWETGDRVGMYLDGYTGYANIDVEASPKTVTLFSRNAIPANSYAYAYYPYSSDNDDKTMTKVVISNVQQGGGTSAMPMAGIPFKIEEEVALPEGSQSTSTSGVIKFLNLGSIIDFKVYSDEYSGETVQYVTFQADGATVSGDAYIDLTGVNANDEASLAMTFMGENDYDYVKVNQEAVVTDAKDNATSIYMVIAPGTYSGTITIGTDVATYTFPFTNKTLTRNGLKHYNMNLNNATREDGVVEVVKTLPYEEAFSSNQGDFTIEDVILPEGLSYVWSWGGATYGMKASAHVGETNYATESWLVSPWIDLTDVDMAALSFDHVHRYAGTAASELTLWAKTDDENADWAQLTIPTWGTGSNWNFVTAEGISLAAFAGKKVKIAFKYTSTLNTAATWEVKNFKVEEADLLETSFTMDAETLTLVIGQSKSNNVTVNSGAVITYTSENPEIATVDAEGNVTGVKEGSTRINVSVPAYNGYTAAEGHYEVVVSEVIVAEEGSILWSEDFESFDASSQPSKGSKELYGGGYASYAYTSTSYCKIYASGTLNGSKEILIPKSSRNENWTVSEIPAAGCSVFTLSFDANQRLSITSSSATIEDVENVGNVYIKKVTVPANTVSFNLVFASAADNNTRLDNIIIKVGAPKVKETQGLSFSESSVTWTIGADCELNIAKQGQTVIGAQTEVSYKSSDEAIAMVDNSGIVTPLGSGNVTITAVAVETDDYKSATASYELVIVDPSALSVTYTQSYSAAGNTVAVTGTAPVGSECLWTTTYNNSNQLTKGNSMTYTISGLDGKKITGLSLSLKTNKSTGEGSVSMKHGSTEFGTYTVSPLGSSYVSCDASVTPVTIGEGEVVTVTISATVNSVYCESITISYN